MREMAYGILASPDGAKKLLLVAHTTKSPSEEEWDGWNALLLESVGGKKERLGEMVNLVLSDGGAPTSMQRTRNSQLLTESGEMPRVAVVSDGLALRTLVRGLSLLMPTMRSFAPADFEPALEYLGFPKGSARHVLAGCEALVHEQLGRGRVKTLEALRAKLRA